MDAAREEPAACDRRLLEQVVVPLIHHRDQHVEQHDHRDEEEHDPQQQHVQRRQRLRRRRRAVPRLAVAARADGDVEGGEPLDLERLARQHDVEHVPEQAAERRDALADDAVEPEGALAVRDEGYNDINRSPEGDEEEQEDGQPRLRDVGSHHLLHHLHVQQQRLAQRADLVGQVVVPGEQREREEERRVQVVRPERLVPVLERDVHRAEEERQHVDEEVARPQLVQQPPNLGRRVVRRRLLDVDILLPPGGEAAPLLAVRHLGEPVGPKEAMARVLDRRHRVVRRVRILPELADVHELDQRVDEDQYDEDLLDVDDDARVVGERHVRVERPAPVEAVLAVRAAEAAHAEAEAGDRQQHDVQQEEDEVEPVEVLGPPLPLLDEELVEDAAEEVVAEQLLRPICRVAHANQLHHLVGALFGRVNLLERDLVHRHLAKLPEHHLLLPQHGEHHVALAEVDRELQRRQPELGADHRADVVRVAQHGRADRASLLRKDLRCLVHRSPTSLLLEDPLRVLLRVSPVCTLALVEVERRHRVVHPAHQIVLEQRFAPIALGVLAEHSMIFLSSFRSTVRSRPSRYAAHGGVQRREHVLREFGVALFWVPVSTRSRSSRSSTIGFLRPIAAMKQTGVEPYTSSSGRRKKLPRTSPYTSASNSSLPLFLPSASVRLIPGYEHA